MGVTNRHSAIKNAERRLKLLPWDTYNAHYR